MTAFRFSQLGEVPNYGGGPLQTSFGTLLPPGGKVAAYVHSSGRAYVDDSTIDKQLVRTMQAGLARCRAGYGDTVVVLPGHAETISGADGWSNLVAGTRIIGHGHGALRPTFSFSATASQLAIAVASVYISGCQFNVDGANGVVNAIDVNGADFTFVGNRVRLASGAALKATIGMSLSAARAFVAGNYFFGTATHNVTDGILIDTAVDGIQVVDNLMQAAATAANGLIRVTGVAATNLFIARNRIANEHTSSTAGIAVGDAASTGMICDNYFNVRNDGTATSQGVIFTGTGSLIKCQNNYVSDEPRENGLSTPANNAT